MSGLQHCIVNLFTFSLHSYFCPHVLGRFAAEFDFRTFYPEGVVLYAESSQDSWFMLGLRGGRIEVQFKNQHTFKVTSGGKAINDGQWHVVRKSF